MKFELQILIKIQLKIQNEQLFFLATKKQQSKIKIGHSRQKSYTPGTTLHRRKPNKRRNHKEEFKSSLIKDPEFQEEYLKMLKTKIKTIKRQDSGNNDNKSKGYNIQKFEYKDQCADIYGTGTLSSLYTATKFFPIRNSK